MNRKKFLFYGRLWCLTVGSALAAGLILVLFGLFQQREIAGKIFWYLLGVDCLMAGGFCLLIVPFSTYLSTVPLMLATGCRRKEVIWNFQILKLLNILGILAVLGIFLLLQSVMGGDLVDKERLRSTFLAGILVLAACGSIGNLTGALSNIIGRWVLIIYMLVSGLAGGFAGVIMEISSGPEVETFGMILGDWRFLTAAVVAALLSCTADLIGSRLILRRTEVRCCRRKKYAKKYRAGIISLPVKHGDSGSSFSCILAGRHSRDDGLSAADEERGSTFSHRDRDAFRGWRTSFSVCTGKYRSS